MAYISYQDVPLYFGNSANTSTLPTEGNNKGVIAQQVQLNYTPNIAPSRVVGKEPTKDNFNLSGPPNASLSFSAYIAPSEFTPADYTGDVGDAGTTFRIGDSLSGISGSGAFMTSFSYTVSPYAPILMQCDFAIYNPLTTTSIGGQIADALNDSVLPATNFSTFGHGAYSLFDGNGANISTRLGDIDTFESVQYQFSANRLPVYTIGNYNITKCELLTAEHSLQIQGDNIQRLVPITGSNPGSIRIQVKNATASTLLTSTVDGRLNAENVTIQGGDLARGSITITELLK